MNVDQTYIIAEAGVNHDGDIAKAHLLIDKAVESGADAAKFQIYRTDEIVSPNSPLADYQKEAGERSQYDMVKRLELPNEDFAALHAYAKEKGIDFITTPFDAKSAEFLASLGVEIIKIPSGEITNIPFLQRVAALKIPTIISTGMSTLEEIAEAIAPFKAAGTEYALLHCVSSYPAPAAQINLHAMKTMKEAFSVPVGYSDHTEGIAVPIAAVALGAQIIEKHFTLNKTDPGPDHAASLEPQEIAEMVQGIRIAEAALGSTEKACQPCESNTRDIARRSVQLVQDAKAGDIITEEMIAIKRPGTGIAPARITEIIGKTLSEDLPAETPLEEKHLT